MLEDIARAGDLMRLRMIEDNGPAVIVVMSQYRPDLAGG